MSASQINESEARRAAQLVKSGTLSPEVQEQVMATLREYSAQVEAKDNFVRTRLNSESHVPSIERATNRIEHLAPSAFASEEARISWENNGEHKSLRAAQRGVDTSSGIDKAVQAKAALLSFKPGAQAAVMEELIRASLGPDVPSRVPVLGQVEGVPVALQAQEDGSYRYHSIDPMGFDLGNLAEFSAELPSIIMETAGGIGGAIAGGATIGAATGGPGAIPGAVVGSAGGAAVLGALALDARVALAKAVGVPDELVDDAVQTEDRLYAAMVAAAGDLVAAGVLGTIRAGKNWSGGRIMSAEQVDSVLEEAGSSLRLSSEFTERTGRELNMTMGQLTGDTDILVAERILQQKARGSTAQRLGSQKIDSARATNDALRKMTADSIEPMDTVRGVSEITEDVQRGVRGASEEAQRQVDLAEEQLNAFTDSMDEAISPESMIKVRDNAHEAAEVAYLAEKDAWDAYRKEVSWRQGEGSNVVIHSPAGSPIKNLLLDMDDDAGRALLESTKRSQQAFVKDAGLPDQGPTRGLAGEFLDPRELHLTLSDLKSRVADMDKAQQSGRNVDGFRRTDMKNMISAIEETINTQPMRYLRGDRLVTAEKAARVRDAWRVANDTSIKTRTLYDNANMRALLEVNPRTKEMVMPSGMIHDRLFRPRDPRFLGDALDAVGRNPTINADLAEELLKKHRNATKSDFTGDAHRKFMDDHHDHIVELGLDPDKIRGAGGLAQSVRQAKDAASAVQKRLARTFGQRLSSDTSDPVNIHDELMKLSKSKVDNVMSFLDREAPVLAQEVRNHSLTNIRADLASGGDTHINFDKLWELVDTKSDQVIRLHGKQYYDDLVLMKRTQQLLNREKLGRSIPGQTVQPGWLDVTRSLFGPLSKKQRFLSAMQRAKKRTEAKGARALITEPGDLYNFVKLRHGSPEDVARFMAAQNLTLSGIDAVDEGMAGSPVPNVEVPVKAPGAPAGNSVVPGRPSPAEAVGGRRP